MWLGGILFVALLAQYLQKKVRIEVLLGLFLCIGVSGSLWIQNNYQNFTLSVHAFNLKTFLAENGAYYPQDYLLSTGALSMQAIDVPVSATQTQCHLQGELSICNFSSPQNQTRFQLPVLYYPHLIQTTVNGTICATYPTFTQSAVLTGITLQKGDAKVITRFTGWPFANLISRLAWGFYALGWLFAGFYWIFCQQALRSK